MSRSPEAHEERPISYDVPSLIEEGVCYLVKGKSAESSYRLIERLADEGVPCLCVSRLHPTRVRAKHRLEGVTLWWISQSPGEGNFDPTAIGTLSRAIEDFIEEHPDGSVVLLDGLEYIAVNIGFDKALFFAEHLNEFVMPRRATVVIPVDPECFASTEFARLERFTGSLDEVEVRTAMDTFEVSRVLFGS